MRRLIPLVISFLIVCFCATAWAEKPKDEGTTAAELAKLSLPTPANTKVLIIPPWDYTSEVTHQRVATAAIYQYFEHQGFAVEPILTGFTKLAADKEIEPGLPLRKSDAVRIGKAAGAAWAVYGEVKELRVYEKSKLFGSSKKIICSLRLAVADCETGAVIFWKARSDTLGDTGFDAVFSRRKSTKLIRVGLQAVSERIFADLFAALPKHDLKGPQPDDASLLNLEKSVWPEGGD